MWSLLFEFGLNLLNWYFSRERADREAKKAFLDFVAKMEHFQMASVKLNASDRAQVEYLKRQVNGKKK